jgi:ribosomal protein S21
LLVANIPQPEAFVEDLTIGERMGQGQTIADIASDPAMQEGINNQVAIDGGKFPPLEPITLAIKKMKGQSDKTLIADGILRRSFYAKEVGNTKVKNIQKKLYKKKAVIICPNCKVQITESKIRNYRLGLSGTRTLFIEYNFPKVNFYPITNNLSSIK